MTVTVEPGNPRDSAVTSLLAASQELMRSLFPPEDNFFLDVDALVEPQVSFFIAKRDGEILGTAAMVDAGAYGEVKSMFVSETARGAGVGAALLARIETEARARGLTWLMLETGNVLHAAHRLYARAGFTERGPFGDYPAAKSSLFMEKKL